MIAVAIVSTPTKRNGNPKASKTATKSAPAPKYPGKAVARYHVQLPKYADQSNDGQCDDEIVGKAGVDMCSKKEREGADADDAGDAV